MRSIQIRLTYAPKFIYGVLLLLSLFAIEVGYYLEKGLAWGSRTIEEPLLGHMITEIGIAGLVGFILTLTFERLSAREFRDLAKRERETISRRMFSIMFTGTEYQGPSPIPLIGKSSEPALSVRT